MSLRSPLTAIRRLATSARRLQDAPAPAPAPPPPSGFTAIRDLTSPSAFTASPSPSPAPPAQAPARGYPTDSLPPPIDPTLDLLTNCLMKHGKKSDAQKMVHNILSLLQESTHLPPQPLLRQSILLASPSIKILSMRKSAKTILTPRALNERQRTRQGIAWILKAAEKGRKGGVPRDQRIAKEVLAVLEGQSEVFKWLEDVHKVGYLNRSNMNVR
ncbi:hypothetical protein I314_00669 [Cryptococcus bacillisporus CA1873]|uniref:Small ribosomal subunit protein uS7 domain-containing protein n=2 Tax=Cryptococcus gattii TaxID=552467 RepID=A0ABR5BK62_CRYGA|nr:hypothetical protein I314_00669 [Cryptococcus bacillisporus CA1873]|eukprot:KIR69557.1 hypothetical protein I314_00669 [Cryptococcus gattii CA1873]